MEITQTSNEPCSYCGRHTHTLAVPPLAGRHSAICISVPLPDHPIPPGCVEYRTQSGERAFLRAEDLGANEYTGRWFYYTGSGWPLLEDYDDEIPGTAKAEARRLAVRAA